MAEAVSTVWDEELSTEREYWRQKLSGELSASTLPVDFPRSNTIALSREKLVFAFRPAIAKRLIEVCGDRDTLVLAALIAVMKILLHKYTGDEEIVVGTTIHRQHADIALLNRTLVLRDRIGDELTMREVLLSVRQTLAEAYEHQKFPFQRLLELLGVERQRDRPALFSVLVQLTNINDPEHAQSASFDLLFAFTKSEGTVSGTIEYDARLFRNDTVDTFAKHFECILERLLAEPDLQLAALSLLEETDWLRYLQDFQPAAVPYPKDRTIHGLFEDQVERTPEAEALRLGERTLSYRELDSQANRLARYLRSAGVADGDRVAILLDHSFDTVIAVLGVLKAGAAYVPLDPEHPKARLGYMLTDSGARLVLTSRELHARLPEPSRAVILEEEWDAIAGHGAEALGLGSSGAEALAYVIYTSGSTGVPKGVQVAHSSLVNYIGWAASAYLQGEACDFPLYTSLSFDLTMTSLYVPLVTGGRLVIYPKRPGEYPLLEVMKEGRVDVVKLTPSHLELIKDRDNRGRRVRRLIVGGEALSSALARQVEDSFGGEVEIFNEYGPTEATVGCMLHRFARSEQEGGSVPIGRPAANVQLYVLDRSLRPVAENIVGELYISGDCLALGYLNRPELTAERFLANPFLPGQRMYRSGDLVRWLPEGILDFLGRADEQVKVRGYRIELNEIRIALNRHPEIRDSAVVVAKEAQGPVLVAYYVAKREIPQQGLHDFLAETLLEETIPSVFVHLRRLPLTLNGKVNLQALPTLAEVRKRLRPGYVAPRNEGEKVMAEIWSSLLGGVEVGVYDNFFQLGGDSIVGIRIVARANEAGFQLAPRQLFQYQTVAELVAAAGALTRQSTAPGPAVGAVPLTPIQKYFFATVDVEPKHFNQAMLLEVERGAGPVVDGEAAAFRPGRWRKAFARLLDHHDALRARFEPASEGWKQQYGSPGEEPPFTWLDLSRLSAAHQDGACEAAAAVLQTSFDLGHGPLLRAALFDLGPGAAARLLIVIHHLVTDAVSWRILLEDLESALRDPASLPPRTTSFKVWAEKLTEFARSEALAEELPHWLALAAAPAPVLPVDFPAGLNRVASAREVGIRLSREETSALLYGVPRAYRTQINDVLLIALTEAFAGWTGQRRMLVDLEGHGREEIVPDVDLSRTVGWFTTLFPVALDLTGRHDPASALKSVKEQLRRIPRRGIGYGLLRDLGDERMEPLRRSPSPEVAFNYLGRFDDTIDAAALLRPSGRPAGPLRDPRQARSHLLEIVGLVAGGRLQLTWSYSENLHRRSTIEALAASFVDHLQALVVHCTSSEVRGYTPSDFPLAELDQETLDRLLAGREVEDLYPLSPLQHGMLFHSIDVTGGGVYFRQLCCTLRGDLDVDAFQRACQEAIDRHPILRTAFVWRDCPEPLQLVLERAELPLEVEDLRGLDEGSRAERLASVRRADLERGFELSGAPLMRLVLLRVGEDRHRLIWSFHHLVLDGWSLSLLLTEIFAFYDAFRLGRPMERERPRPFREYITWLRRQDRPAAEQFWRRALAGFPSATPLASDRPAAGAEPRPEEQQDRQVWLPVEATTLLQEWARRHQLTLNTAVQGAWALLLARESGERDVIFGAVSSGRSAVLPGIDTMLGVFINTLPVRVGVAPGAALVDWLRDVQDRQAQVREYEYSSLAEVQTWSEVPKGEALFHSLMAFENYPVDKTLRGQKASLRFEDFDHPEPTNYPLNVTVGPAQALSLALSYDCRLFDGVTVERKLWHLRNLLQGFPEHRGTLAEVAMLSEAERHQLAVEWGATAALRTRAGLVHDLFAEQAARTPEAVAVAGDSGSLSYAELELRSTRLARSLRRLGVGPEVRVGLCLERSPLAVVGLLGILKAGGACVPLDPAYPPERLAFLIEDSGVAVVLVQGSTAGALGPAAVQVFDLETAWDAVEREGAGSLASGVDDRSLAYVIYTSGSTGRPKGVMVEHGSLAGVLAASRETFRWHGADAMACAAPFSFDIFLFELLNPLLVGGCCHLLAIQPSVDVEAWVDLLPSLTRVHAVPALMRQLVEASRRRGEPGSGLRTLFVGGDAVGADLLLEMREAFAEAEIRVLYGPTEGTIIASSFRVAPGRQPERTSIGRPLPGVDLRILDVEGGLVPAGAVGEISIGGRGVSRGYLGRPDLTAERFVPCPWSAVPGGRRYLTGDLGRWSPDGTLDFMGRIDRQVKVRGFRIELGEVEAALASQAAVKEAAVVARPGADGERQLVAYFVPADGSVSTELLRQALQRRLPAYMVPAAFVALESLPLTPQGKVDRKALPVPEEGVRKWEGPRNVVEELLAGIWSEVLRRERIGIQESFFELGGHSLMATQVISRVRRHFGIDLPLRALFEGPTIEELARQIDQLLRDEGERPEPVIAPVGREADLPLSFAQERLWFLDQLDPGTPTYNMPLALQLGGRLEMEVLRRSLQRLTERHEVLRTRFVTVEGRPVQVIGEVTELALPLVDLASLEEAAREAEAHRLLREERVRPFDLSRGPLLRTGLLRLTSERHAVWLTMHHIVSDGWSFGVMVRELGELYRAQVRAEAAALPEIAVQYADFAVWQRAWLQGEELERQLGYWRKRLEGAPPLQDLPLDRPRPLVQSFKGSHVPFRVSRDLTRSLVALSRSRGATLFMVILTGLQALLSRLTGQEDLTVGTAVANRNRREIEGLIGFFVNALVLRADLSADPTFTEALVQVRETALGAYAHQDLPFEKLVEELAPQRSLAHTPLFQVMLNLQNVPVGTLELPGLTLEPIHVETAESAKFDISLSLEETAEGLVGQWRYNSELFDSSTLARVSRSLEILLAEAAARPESRISELRVLSEAERHQHAVAWNDTAEELPPATGVHTLFARQARHTPEAVALEFEGETLTYGELDRRSDRLAAALRERGVGPEVPVAIAMERCLEMVVSLLGVLKAGGVCLPLDPEFPAQRLAWLLEDSRPRLVLTQSRWEAALPAGLGRLYVETGWSGDPSLIHYELEEVGPAPDSLAWILYTSGSTGRPKGVLISHGGLVNRLLWAQRTYPLTAADRVLQKAPFIFDFSLWECFGPLIAGARAVLARPGGNRDSAYLARIIAERGITFVHFVPSLLRLFLDEVGDRANLRCVFSGGEALPSDLLERFFTRLDVTLRNQYGPTEAAIDVTHTLIRPETEARVRAVWGGG
ncbi:MAG TPA: amino acid adenylation domain-containing protein, partial [Thermoanaerobaculia bacterium]|nr:amino acid adenylation domain-containing protein [Thermoanaerobaculia bacterium]